MCLCVSRGDMDSLNDASAAKLQDPCSRVTCLFHDEDIKTEEGYKQKEGDA